MRQLAALGLIEIDVEGHGGLALAGDCRAVLKGERSVELRRDPAAARAAGKARSAARATALADPASEALFQRLRQWRMQTARAQGVPPYVIFHDATLQAIATVRPRTRRDLEGIPGLGAAKLERYGAALLAFMAE